VFFLSKSSLKGGEAFLYFLHDEDKNFDEHVVSVFAEILRFSGDYLGSVIVNCKLIGHFVHFIFLLVIT
jgi:hypothetical protein